MGERSFACATGTVTRLSGSTAMRRVLAGTCKRARCRAPVTPRDLETHAELASSGSVASAADAARKPA
jgi:hypothetical protein